jgi:ubiquitin carboxyl-terminal hydrolase 8
MNKYSNYADKGLTGLVNLGNTCYLNSCMQILSHCYLLNEIIEDNIKKTTINGTDESIILLEWNNLRQLMWSKNCVVSPNRYVNAVHRVSRQKGCELFSGFVQNDFPEFLVFILECFHNGLKRDVDMKINGNVSTDRDKLAIKCYETMRRHFNNDYSDIINRFYGIQVSQIISIDNRQQLSVSCEPYCLISLSLTETSKTIYECLDDYCKSELMSGDNAWYNDKTNAYQDVIKRTCFWNLPDILIIDLKRFDNRLKKIHKQIDVPLTGLDLSKYVIGYHSKEYVYNLFGVSNHMGSAFSGHYTANVKNANNKWYQFNDQIVSPIEDNKVVTPNAYCFFYMKQ